MPATDSSSNVDQPSAGRETTSGGERDTTVALGRPRHAAAASKAGNYQLRAEIALPADSSAPGDARTAVREWLSGLTAHQILHDAELLVSELVTNSVVHGELGAGDTVLVTVSVAADALRFEIDNPGTAGAVARTPPVRQPRPGGFGLALVERLAASWGVSRTRSTTVWFELERA
jgi:anti-sigma regulatory factor (Ser/Thr protein kinase)